MVSPAAPPVRTRPFWAFWRRPVFVPAIRLHGVIGAFPLRGPGLALFGLERAIDRAFGVRRAPAVALIVNCPGGAPVQAALIARRIRRLAEQKRRTVLAFVEDVATSGGYWLATAADEIFVEASSIVGSIGVISAGFGFAEALARLGIERRVHTSGARKSFLDPFRPERPEDVALLAELQAEIHERFKEQVRSRRAGRLRASEEELFDGRVWTGARAVELGLADGVGEIRTVLEERYGPEVVVSVVNPPRRRFLERFGFSALASEATAAVLAMLEERAMLRRLGL
ncbi:MAG: S49 family peptidase [Geminicoccaceae bacterium]|nr:S49 family peptidase [Geminicoccaceae bacterium]MCS7268003.1 S49 family peptidase [Geminicoccaceae bacterium]MCX7631582.1 S49 family peptidase [Geminicoccaceae bacterium]MDW8124083.1 S49 family peptidase [Geminicoccaceae bacterium]MDW8340254.1 S49 family peptidase [Geminicoccaceae bacterium]